MTAKCLWRVRTSPQNVSTTVTFLVYARMGVVALTKPKSPSRMQRPVFDWSV